MISQLFFAAITVYFEARGESFQGQVAVAQVIFNRVENRGKSIEEIVFAPKQFSCFNNGTKPIRDYKSFITAFEAVEEALIERMRGKKLHGADHYFRTDLNPWPSWAKNMDHIVTIDNHSFFNSKTTR